MFEGDLYSEDEVIAFACGFLGKHPYNFLATVTPRRPSHMNFVRKQLNKFLVSNPNWQAGVKHIFDELEENVEAEVFVYNSLNFCGWLTDLYKEGSSKRIPLLAIKVEGDTAQAQYFGTLLWNGVVSKVKLQRFLKSVYSHEGLAVMRAVN